MGRRHGETEAQQVLKQLKQLFWQSFWPWQPSCQQTRLQDGQSHSTESQNSMQQPSLPTLFIIRFNVRWFGGCLAAGLCRHELPSVRT